MFDERNIGFATGSTLIRRLDEVATQPKVTIGTIGNYWRIQGNFCGLFGKYLGLLGPIGMYWGLSGKYLGLPGGRFGSFRKQDC